MKTLKTDVQVWFGGKVKRARLTKRYRQVLLWDWISGLDEAYWKLGIGVSENRCLEEILRSTFAHATGRALGAKNGEYRITVRVQGFRETE